MGELRNNKASSGPITKKTVSFSPFETIGTKNLQLTNLLSPKQTDNLKFHPLS